MQGKADNWWDRGIHPITGWANPILKNRNKIKVRNKKKIESNFKGAEIHDNFKINH